MTVRELTTIFGLDIDEADFAKADRMVEGLKHQLEGTHARARRLATGMTNLGRTMTMFVTAPMVAMGGMMVRRAAEAEEIRGKFGDVFKELTAETRAWVNETAEGLGRSKVDLEEYLARLQDTFVPIGFARKEAAEMSKKLTLLAADLAAFNNETDAQAVGRLTSALTGQHETVKKYGIIIQDSTLKEELRRMGVAKSVQQATEQQKAQARLNLIMRMSADAQGAAQRESKGLLQQWIRLKAALKDLISDKDSGLGTMLLPIAIKLVQSLKNLVKWFSGLSSGTKKFIMIIAGVVLILGPVLLAFGLLGTALITARINWLAYSRTLAEVGNVSLLAQAKILLLPLAIVAAFAALFLLLEDFYGWMNGKKSVFGELLGEFSEVEKKFKSLLPDIFGLKSKLSVPDVFHSLLPTRDVHRMKKAWGELKAIYADIKNNVNDIQGRVSQGSFLTEDFTTSNVEASQKIKSVWAGLFGFIRRTTEQAQVNQEEYANWLDEDFGGSNEEFANRMREVWENVLEFFKDWGVRIKDAFLGLFDPLIDGIKEVWEWLSEKLGPWVDRVVGAAQKVANFLTGGPKITKEDQIRANQAMASAVREHGPIRGLPTPRAARGGGPAYNRLGLTTNHQSNITVKVESGTPAQQLHDIGEKLRKVVQEENEKVARRIQADNPVTE